MADRVRCPVTGRIVLGQRPAHVLWTPSKPLPWWLGYWEDGRRFSAEQERALIALGRDPVTAEAMDVRREVNVHDGNEAGLAVWHELLAVFLFACPIVGKGKAGRVRVLGPNGKPKDVRPDGWAHKPTLHIYRGPAW